jgi:hypothetical protein
MENCFLSGEEQHGADDLDQLAWGAGRRCPRVAGREYIDANMFLWKLSSMAESFLKVL